MKTGCREQNMLGSGNSNGQPFCLCTWAPVLLKRPWIVVLSLVSEQQWLEATNHIQVNFQETHLFSDGKHHGGETQPRTYQHAGGSK